MEKSWNHLEGVISNFRPSVSEFNRLSSIAIAESQKQSYVHSLYYQHFQCDTLSPSFSKQNCHTNFVWKNLDLSTVNILYSIRNIYIKLLFASIWYLFRTMELVGAMIAIIITDHQVHWLATAISFDWLCKRIGSCFRHLNTCLLTK